MKFELDRRAPVTTVSLEGAPEPGDFARLLDALEKDPEWRPGRSLLVDKTGYDTSGMTVGDVHDIASVCTERAAVLGPSRIAILVARDLEFGMSRMFLAFVKWAADADVFRDRERAETWLASQGASGGSEGKNRRRPLRGRSAAST